MLLVYAQNNRGVAVGARQRFSIPAPFDNRLCGLYIPLHRLMEESERQLESFAHGGSAEEMHVAQRILENPEVFRHWESEHTQIMHRVAAAPYVPQQKRVLLSAVLSLLHRKSLFEYLREYHVHDRPRELLLTYFHGGNDYARAVVIEHGNYLRSAASYMCSTELGLRLMQDTLFEEPLREYEVLYTAYFAAYCKLLTSQTESDSGLGKLVYKLKGQLGLRRRQLLNGSQSLH